MNRVPLLLHMAHAAVTAALVAAWFSTRRDIKVMRKWVIAASMDIARLNPQPNPRISLQK